MDMDSISIEELPPSMAGHRDEGATADDDAANKTNNTNVLLRFKIALGLGVAFLTAEIVCGIVAQSLAVVSDAAHRVLDVVSLIAFMMASKLASMEPTPKYTFGFRRIEALAALLSMLGISVLSVALAVEAMRRIVASTVDADSHNDDEDEDDDVDGKLMTIIAAIGVVINVALAIVLGEDHVHLPGDDAHGHCHHDHHQHHDDHHHHHDDGVDAAHCHDHDDESGEHLNRDLFDPSSSQSQYRLHGSEGDGRGDGSSCCHHEHGCKHQMRQPLSPSAPARRKVKLRNINLHAAYVHVLADLAESVALLVAGLIIWWKPSWTIVDPICTILFCIFVVYSTIGVIRASLSVLLERAPSSVDVRELTMDVESVRGVSNVHALRVWSISHGEGAMSVHGVAVDPRRAMEDIVSIGRRFGLSNITVQLQRPDDATECLSCGLDEAHWN